MTAPNLPEPIAAYFDADKRGDPAAVARCFTEEAVVRDEGHRHTGWAAIREWKTEASAKYSYTSQPLAVEQTGRRLRRHEQAHRRFPGQPGGIGYAFRLERGKIASLEIAV